MWFAPNTRDIQMTVGDYGVKLPFKFKYITIANDDYFKFTIKTGVDDEPLIEIDITDIENNKVEIELSKQDSDKLSVGTYFYNLDWYQDNNFNCNLIRLAKFEVMKK